MAIVRDPRTGQMIQVPDEPQTGLIGSEQALAGGLTGGLAGIGAGVEQARADVLGAQRIGRRDISSGFGQAIAPLNQFAGPGQQAFGSQAALSGALGGQAQQQAFDEFQASPGQQFLQEQAEQALLRNQSAIGGLGGGNVRSELQRQAVGLAQQDLSNQFDRLGQVSGQGLQAAGQQAGLRGQQAQALASIGQASGQQLAGVAERGGVGAADLAFRTGQSLAGGRTRAGEQIAQAVGGTTSALSNLISQQGTSLSNIIGAGGGNLANILATAGQQTGASREQLAALLSNLAVQQGTQTASLPSIGQFAPAANQVQQTGQLLGGIGGLLSAFNQPKAA